MPFSVTMSPSMRASAIGQDGFGFAMGRAAT